MARKLIGSWRNLKAQITIKFPKTDQTIGPSAIIYGQAKPDISPKSLANGDKVHLCRILRAYGNFEAGRRAMRLLG
eukprot:scaffold469891_cov14-Prasinocladus_malaysianus.AAC.1